MANVNLISARRAERVRLSRLARGLSAACVITGGLSLAGLGFLGSQVFMTKGAVAAVEGELSKLRPIREQIERDEADRLALQPKILTLTQAQGATKRWFGIMEGFKRAVPDQTWLTNVSVEANAATGKMMKISGVTVNQARVGETMYRLSSQPEFYQRVDLRFTAVRDGESDNVEFELAAPLTEDKTAAQVAGGGNATQVN